MTTAADDFRQLSLLAKAAVAAAYDGSAFSTAYSAHNALYETIKERCTDPAYYQEFHAAVAKARS